MGPSFLGLGEDITASTYKRILVSFNGAELFRARRVLNGNVGYAVILRFNGAELFRARRDSHKDFPTFNDLGLQWGRAF